MQRAVRGSLQQNINYWDYLINQTAESPADLTALRQTTKEDVAWLFVNQYI